MKFVFLTKSRQFFTKTRFSSKSRQKFELKNLCHSAYHSPLYRFDGDSATDLNVDGVIKYLIDNGADPMKLIVQITVLGIIHTLKDSNHNGVTAEITGDQHSKFDVNFVFHPMK